LFTAASSFFSNPIFRSGEDCRQFNFNSYPGISGAVCGAVSLATKNEQMMTEGEDL
jgi:hypothetical protein